MARPKSAWLGVLMHSLIQDQQGSARKVLEQFGKIAPPRPDPTHHNEDADGVRTGRGESLCLGDAGMKDRRVGASGIWTGGDG